MKVITWMLIKWARDWDLRDEPMDVACWIPAVPGLPIRCLCGYGWPPGTPADATKVECEGPFRHVWRDALEEIGDRVRAREDAAREAHARGIGQTGRSTSESPATASTGPSDGIDVERPTSNNSGRSDVSPVDEKGFAMLVISELPACTTCNRIGHLAADCPNEGGSRGQA